MPLVRRFFSLGFIGPTFKSEADIATKSLQLFLNIFSILILNEPYVFA